MTTRQAKKRDLPETTPSHAPALVIDAARFDQGAWRSATFAAALALFVSGWLMGMLGVHSSTDNWIAIATGRHIIETGSVPTTDPFSYTFNGEPFFNQNWLSHVAFYLLYDRVGPSAIPVFTWLMNLAIYGLIAGAAWLRTGSWFTSLIAAGIVAACARHLYDTRPQTVGYVCFATLAFILNYYLVPRARARYLPAVAVLPLMLVWGSAHGSFVLGYGLLVFFGIAWFATWFARRGLGVTVLNVPTHVNEVVVAAGAALIALVATIGLGPYGMSNITHSFVVQESPLWRQVAEWNPPWQVVGRGLPTIGFWISVSIGATIALFSVATSHVLAGENAGRRSSGMSIFSWVMLVPGIGLLLAAVGIWTASVQPGGPVPALPHFWFALYASSLCITGWIMLQAAARNALIRPPLTPVTLYDGVLFLVGLFFALQSRRFAALFFILCTPLFALWVRILLDAVEPAVARLGKLVLAGGAAIASAVLLFTTTNWAYGALVTAFADRPQYNLLERYVQYADTNPVDSIRMLQDMDVVHNVFCEWTVAGNLIARVPNARVFMDGRAQQVYSEEHYILFNSMFDPRPGPRAAVLEEIENRNTDVLMLRPSPDAIPLIEEGFRSPRWQVVLNLPSEVLLFRRDSPVYARLLELERADKLKWPDSPYGLTSRATLLLAQEPPDTSRAIDLLKEVAEGDPLLAFPAYGQLARAARLSGREAEIAAFLAPQRERLAAAPVPPGTEPRRDMILKSVDQIIAGLQSAPAAPTTAPRP